jgi:DNA-binding NtrC family response regulator
VDTTVKSGEFMEVTGGSLVVLPSQYGQPTGQRIAIGADPGVVGRGGHCQVVLDDPRVSTSHCELVAMPKGVLLVDLDSRNGTYVNQVRLERRGGVYLTVDSRIRCGQTWLDFRCEGREQVPLSSARDFGPLVGHSIPMRRIYAQLAKVSAHELNVLVTGETGTGKELVAQAIHRASRRSTGPLITVDCTTIPAPLAESMLFGHEKGAFTGAVARHTSPFIAAQGGTIFFDELGELPIEIQPKLLRALETRQIQSVGSNRPQPIDVRVICATRRNLHVEMNARRFRDDLYYRFAQVVVELPALREHTEDIPDLVARFLAELGDPRAMSRIEKPSMDRLLRHDWPGNVRELRNIVLAAHAQSEGGPIEFADHLSPRLTGIDMADRISSLRSFQVLRREVLEAFEREYFAKLHRESGGNLSEMSRRSGIARSTVREYLQRLGLRSEE